MPEDLQKSQYSNLPDGLEVIDCHCHVYPEKIAAKVTKALSDFYTLDMEFNEGTSANLKKSIEGSPIKRCIIHSVATRPEQVGSINDFIASETANDLAFTGFMTLHQDHPDPEKEIDRAIGMGLKGMKLHPDTQQVNIDDPRMMEIYEIAESKNLPIIFHCGDYRFDNSHPRRLKKVLDAFPGLVVDAAHFGGWMVFDQAVEYLEDERCFLDMSSSITFLGMRRVEELVRIYGADRIMFGSDFPMWNPAQELKLFTSGNFTENELELLLCDNARRFLGEV